MSDWKYVMVQLDEDRRIPIIFPGELVHADIGHMVVGMLRSGTMPDDAELVRIVSAGHISSLMVLSADGKSESLNLGSDPDDKSIINQMPYNHGRTDGINMEMLLAAKFGSMLMEQLR